MNDLICPKCGKEMIWLDFDLSWFADPSAEKQAVVLARCDCGHEVSLEPAESDQS